MPGTGLVYDEAFNWHDTGDGALYLSQGKWLQPDVYYENRNRLRPSKQLLDHSGMTDKLTPLKPRLASREELEYFHTPEYLDKIKSLSEGSGGEAGPFARVGPGSYEYVSLAVGGALTGIDAIMSGDVRNAYGLQRPPGKHAERETGTGFCVFNTFGIAAYYLKKRYKLDRVLIIDWDCHHGNGIQNAFYDDPSVMYIGLHQSDTVPIGIGAIDEVGAGPGQGYNVNIPMPAGTGDAGYRHAFEKIVAPIANQFKPQFILGVAGYANNIYDPLGRMQVTAEGYHHIISQVKDIADRHCDGRLLAVHEGGFGAYMPFCTLRLVEGLSGLETGVEDPFGEVFKILPNQLSGDQIAAIARAREVQMPFWDLTG